MLVVNLKTYKQGSGKNCLKLLKKLKNCIVCVQPGDMHYASKVKIPLWAQHVDAIDYGSNTGYILPENLKEYGCKGVLINHSEHRVKNIKEIVQMCKKLKLKTMVLVPTPADVLKVKKFKPDYIGYEPPSLIGSKTDSVASKPKSIEKAVKNAGKIPLYIGAGVKSKEDVKVGKKLGAKGILVASAVVKAKNPSKVIEQLR